MGGFVGGAASVDGRFSFTPGQARRRAGARGGLGGLLGGFAGGLTSELLRSLCEDDENCEGTGT